MLFLTDAQGKSSPLESHRRVTRREKVQGPIKKVLSRNGVQNPPRLQSTLFLPQCDKILGKHSCTGWAPLYVRRVVDNSEIQLQTDREGFQVLELSNDGVFLV